MNAQEREIITVFGQRLDDHIRACSDIHTDIKNDIRDIARKLDSVTDSVRRREGSQAATSWLLMFGVAIFGAAVTIIGVITGVVIQVVLH